MLTGFSNSSYLLFKRIFMIEPGRYKHFINFAHHLI